MKLGERLELLGFLVEVLFFILTGYFLSSGRAFLALFALIIALLFAYITGKQIEKNVLARHKKKWNK